MADLGEPLEALIDSLLYEGYALYPYTPGATKNATPTPFGIVYPTAYAQQLTSTFDHLELHAELTAPADAVLRAEVRFLMPDGARHRAVARRIAQPAGMIGALARQSAEKTTLVRRETGAGLVVGTRLTARALGACRYEVILRIENRTLVRSGLDRAEALGHALLSTHPLLGVTGGRFISPLERAYDSVNTFPVLATPGDDTILGAAIVLPEHPQIAPESRGSMFDGTEIEEALTLHIQVLSEAERAAISQQDPTVTAMIERVAAATPEDLAALHGRVTLRDPQTDTPPTEPAGLDGMSVGEASADVHGQTFRRGGKVIIRPGVAADLQARMLAGRTATIERIMTAYDGRIHLGLTVDDDPGQGLMRETGRFLYFFAPELEVIDT
ncbi:MAG TPA: hypothetical protein VFN48_03925 [Solirubrobacteraceae bacterium]|nr:hypothetical protein [Solirubrobacteraceae bacterium]